MCVLAPVITFKEQHILGTILKIAGAFIVGTSIADIEAASAAGLGSSLNFCDRVQFSNFALPNPTER